MGAYLRKYRVYLFICSLIDSDDSHKVSEDVVDTNKLKAQSRSQNTPLKANVIQSSLLSATAPLVSAGLVSPQGESLEPTQGSLSGDESGVYSEDALPVLFFLS